VYAAFAGDGGRDVRLSGNTRLCDCKTIAMALQWRFATALQSQWLCNGFAIALQWPCNGLAIGTASAAMFAR
jgi:hypothetical protein